MLTHRLHFLTLWLCCLLGIFSSALAEQAIPPLQTRVTDQTQTLSASERNQIEQRLTQFEQRTGAQIAILMVPNTQPETIEQYSIRVAEAWKLGQQGKDNGVLLLIAKNDRAARIEVGYGLEGELTDLASSRIIRDVIVPHFQTGDYSGGLDAALNAIMARLEGGTTEDQTTATAPSDAAQGMLPILLGVAFFASQIFRAMTNRLTGAALGGAITGGIGYLIFGSVAAAITIAILGFLLGLVAGVTSPGRYIGGNNHRWGGWPGGGGGFGGGGFRGGGGSFGGGGASGRW